MQAKEAPHAGDQKAKGKRNQSLTHHGEKHQDMKTHRRSSQIVPCVIVRPPQDRSEVEARDRVPEVCGTFWVGHVQRPTVSSKFVLCRQTMQRMRRASRRDWVLGRVSVGLQPPFICYLIVPILARMWFIREWKRPRTLRL